MSIKISHKTWWGEKFVSALEAYIDPGRLQRGKAYRTDNRVLTFQIKGGEVTATIRGNINAYFGVTKEPRYKVLLKFDQISTKQWQGIINNISGNALWLSKLMLNEIPNTIEKAFGHERLLPASYQDVKASCSCPDYSDPCKHIAGVYFRIANLLDSDPMLLFQLRGLAPEKLHQELQKTELGQAFSEHLTLPENVDMHYQQHKYTPTHIQPNKTAAKQAVKQVIKPNQFWSMPANALWVDDRLSGDIADEVDQGINEEVIAASITERDDSLKKSWPIKHSNNETMGNIAAGLIKKQGDFPEFWQKNNSFIGAMALFYDHTKKKNNKDLF